MSYVPVQIPDSPNILSIVNHILTLAETEPIVADHVLPILKNAIDFALTSGKATNPDVWVRAFQAAAAYVETLKVDDEWLSLTPINRSTRE